MLFKQPPGREEPPVPLPCGSCTACKLTHARNWALRCDGEASLYAENDFLTLTYDEDHLPPGEYLRQSDVQKFFRRLRKAFPGSHPRYFYCGEYGGKLGRPHYHVLLFNFGFKDKSSLCGEGDHRLYTSETLSKLWPHGFSSIGSVTFQSASYVARYCLKKVGGVEAHKHYQGKPPEYTRMSRRPGIGHDWYKKFKNDVYPSSEIVRDGHAYPPPRYYDTLYEREAPMALELIKADRVRRALERGMNYRRLDAREQIQKSRLALKAPRKLQ